MSSYTFYFTTVMSASVTVEAEDAEEALDLAYEELPPVGLCAQCTGWGQQWNRDTGGDWELDETSYDVDGSLVTRHSH